MFAFLVVDSQQTGTLVINAGNDGASFTLPSQVTRRDKALLEFGFSATDDQESPVVYLSDDGTEIVAEGDNFGNDIAINFNLIQFRHNSDISVDHFRQLVNALGDSVITSNMTFSGLSTFPLFNAASSSAGEEQFDLRLSNPFSSRSFIADARLINAASNRTLAFQLVQFYDATSVSTFRTSGHTTNQREKDVTVSTVDPLATLVVCYPDNMPTGSAISRLVFNAWMRDGTTVRIRREGIGTDMSGGFFTGYLIQGDNFSVRTGPVSGTGSFLTASLSTAITRQGATVVNSFQYGRGEGFMPSDTTLSNALSWQHSSARPAFGSNQTTVNYRRGSALASQFSGVAQVIQWNTAGAQFFDTSPWTDELSPDPNQEPQVWDLCTIASAVTARLGDRWDLPFSTVSFWINQAYQIVANMAHHDGLEKVKWSSMSTGSAYFDGRIPLPPDYSEPIVLSTISWDDSRATGFFRKSGTTMTELSNEEFEALDSAVTSEDPPTHFSQYGRWIEVWPSPSSNYSLQLKYKEYPSDMTDCGIYPHISPPWRFAIVLKSEELLAEVIGDDQRAAIAHNKFVSYTGSIDDDRGKRQKNESSPKRVRVLGWSGPKRI